MFHVKRFAAFPSGSRSRRFDDHDYRGGAYFITTNTVKRTPLFGTVKRGRMYLNDYGKIVIKEWHRTGELREEVSLDAFIVMPDHVHGIVWIAHSDVETKSERTREDEQEPNESSRKGGREMHLATTNDLPPGLEKSKPGTLSTIIGCFKAAITRRINRERNTPGDSVWQSSFHDRIVRTRQELRRIRRYIRTNPQHWSKR